MLKFTHLIDLFQLIVMEINTWRLCKFSCAFPSWRFGWWCLSSALEIQGYFYSCHTKWVYFETYRKHQTRQMTLHSASCKPNITLSHMRWSDKCHNQRSWFLSLLRYLSPLTVNLIPTNFSSTKARYLTIFYHPCSLHSEKERWYIQRINHYINLRHLF